MEVFKPENTKMTVIKEYLRQKENIKLELQRRKRRGFKFCLSFSLLKLFPKKWVALCIHFDEECPVCIGTIKIDEVTTSISQKVKEKLNYYGLTL